MTSRRAPQVLVCFDKFRGSVSAGAAGAALVAGLVRAAPEVRATAVPIADGGEGTVDAFVGAGYARHSVVVTGPLGKPVTADLAVHDGVAVVELAQASGLALLGEHRDPMRASTSGTGELIRRVLDLGCRRIVIAVGGSASTDGGAGLLVALGARLLDAKGAPVAPGGAGLAQLARIDLSRLDPRLHDVDVVLASDVDNPLLGADGAAAVFGPQKGATPSQTAELDAALARFADALDAATGTTVRDAGGAGAAGGVGYGVLAGLGARRVGGADFVLDQLGVDEYLQTATLVVTGEGRFDEQSLRGKAPARVLDRAARHGVPAIVVAGDIAVAGDELRRHGVTARYSLVERAGSVARAMREAGPLLEEIGAEIVR